MFNAQGIVKPKRLEFEKNTKSEVYGKFSAGPFERGYGVTTGNSLRRMLLSSIEGAAIAAIKFEGIFHDFSSIFVEKNVFSTSPDLYRCGISRGIHF